MEVIPGIHQLKVPIPNNPIGFVNTYLVQGEGDWMLVDTGWNTPEAFNALESQIKELGIGFEDITQIVVTHFHGDHYGLVGRLKQLSGAKIALHQVEREFIHSRYLDMDNLLEQVAQWLHFNGVPNEELPELQKASLGVRKFVSPALPEIALYGGEKITTGSFGFEIIWTPGHSPGHICLYEPTKRILISGDHILPTITPNVSLHPQSGDNPLGDYLNSLSTLNQLEVDLVLPAHEHVFTGLKRRISELIKHHDERKAAIVEAIKEEKRTAYEISARIPWIVMGEVVPFDKLLPFDRRLAVLEALAHLELLRIEGKVEKMVKDGIAFYNAA